MPELDLGNVKGPQGKSAYQSALDAGYSGSEEAFNTAMAKAPDAVLYTAQSLTDEQKAQARGNIAAAVAGGGVMECATDITVASEDETYESFCQKVDAVLATMPDNSVKFVFSYPPGWYGYGYDMAVLYKAGNDYASLKSIGSYNFKKPNGFMMIKISGAWKPLEYIDPPMDLGVEYRTTERYLGKPVYAKLIPCETIPANSTYTAYIDSADEAHVINAIVSAHIYSMSDSQYANKSIVYIVGGRALGGGNDQSYITLKNNYAGNSAGYNVLVKYTKSTD